MSDLAWGAGILKTQGIVAASSRGTGLPMSTANTKGAWQQLVASLDYDITGFIVQLNGLDSPTASHLVDIGVGAAGSEQVLIPNILFSTDDWSVPGTTLYFPVAIPAGTRIAARTQNDYVGGTYLQCSVIGISGNKVLSLGRVEACGINTADSGGTSVDPGTAANTKGSYSQLIAATAFDYRGIIVAFGSQGNSHGALFTWLVDIAVGAAASEQIVVPDLAVYCDDNSRLPVPNNTAFIPLSIPAGSRIAARAACSITTATTRLVDVAVYGVG